MNNYLSKVYRLDQIINMINEAPGREKGLANKIAGQYAFEESRESGHLIFSYLMDLRKNKAIFNLDKALQIATELTNEMRQQMLLENSM